MKTFLRYIHNLRGLAILYVVVVHARALNPEWLSHPAVNTFFDTFFDPSEGNGTILFLFIGGFLFQHLTHQQFDFGKYVEQKFKVIILPYILISVPIIILRLNTHFESLALPDGFDDRSVLFKFFYMLLTGAHMPPFWFIATIVLFYLTAPLLRAIDNPKFYSYVFPFVLLVTLFTFRPEHNANPLMAYVHYLPIYILGMWTSFNRERILANSKALLAFTGSVYALLCVLDLTGHIGVSRDLTFENVIHDGVFSFNIYAFKAMALCFTLMLILYRFSEQPMSALNLLGNYSFGIFFVHYLFISVSRKVIEHFKIDIPFSIPAYLVYFTFILLGSVLVVYLVKRVAGEKSRYLIGS